MNSRRAVLRSAAGIGGLTAGSALVSTVSAPSAAAASTYTGQTGWINVKTDFGAKGDGSSDDWQAIQNALDAVPSGGAVVYFPNAVYEISQTLKVTVAGTKLLGDKASTGFSAGGSNQTTIDAKAGFAANSPMIEVADVADFAMRDLTVHGPNTTGTSVGISLTGGGSAMLENVLVGRTAGDGVYADGVGPLVLRQVGVFHAGQDGTLPAHGFNLQGIADSWYTDCLAAGCSTSGWNIQGGDNSTWTGCRAEDGYQYGFWFHDVAGLWGGYSFVGCSTDLNDADGFRIANLTGNGVIQLTGCEFRRDGNNAGAGSTTSAGIAVADCAIPVLLDGTTVTARQGDHAATQPADGPHHGLNVTGSTFVAVNGGYYSCDSTGAPINWDGTGSVPVGPNVLTARVSASVPAFPSFPLPWSTAPNAQIDQSSTADTSALVQTLSGVTTNNNPLIKQYHPAAATKGIGLLVTGDTTMRWVVQADGTQVWGGGAATRDTTLKRLGAAQLGTPDSDFIVALAGKGLRIAEGTNAKMGTAVLNGTTAVKIDTTAVTANSRIFLTIQAPGGTPGGIAYVTTRTPGASFSIAGAAGDKSTVAWILIEPA
jgi:hypothetical protein